MDDVRRVPPILIDLQGVIRDQGAELIEPTSFVVARCLIEIAVSSPEQNKQEKFDPMSPHPLPDPFPRGFSRALLCCRMAHDRVTLWRIELALSIKKR